MSRKIEWLQYHPEATWASASEEFGVNKETIRSHLKRKDQRALIERLNKNSKTRPYGRGYLKEVVGLLENNPTVTWAQALWFAPGRSQGTLRTALYGEGYPHLVARLNKATREAEYDALREARESGLEQGQGVAEGAHRD